jgi:hypothetical protein
MNAHARTLCWRLALLTAQLFVLQSRPLHKCFAEHAFLTPTSQHLCGSLRSGGRCAQRGHCAAPRGAHQAGQEQEASQDTKGVDWRPRRRRKVNWPRPWERGCRQAIARNGRPQQWYRERKTRGGVRPAGECRLDAPSSCQCVPAWPLCKANPRASHHSFRDHYSLTHSLSLPFGSAHIAPACFSRPSSANQIHIQTPCAPRQHDDYDGYRQPRYAQAPVVYQQAPMVVPTPAPAPARPAALSTAGLSGKLFISNLEEGVSTDDIEVRA